MLDVLEFWLERGADGFRMGVINHLFETENLGSEEYRDASGDRDSYDNIIHRNTVNQPESYEFIYDARALMDAFTENSADKTTRIIMTEAYATAEEMVLWHGSSETRKGSHIPFNFQLITEVDESSSALDFKTAIDNWLDILPVWGTQPNWVLGNHDRPRIGYRYGEGRHESLAILAMFLPGVNTIYYVRRHKVKFY